MRFVVDPRCSYLASLADERTPADPALDSRTHYMTGVVLAGGHSGRIGTNKALLELGGARIIERVLCTIRPLFHEVAIVANDLDTYAYLGVPIWPDRIPEKGPLGGVYTAVFQSASPQTFCIACDMPFPNPAVIAYLQDVAPGYDVVVPRTTDGYQPLHAIYSKTCLPQMEAMIHADQLKIDRLFPAVRLRIVEEKEFHPKDPHLLCFVNVNTWEDLERAAKLAKGSE